MSELLMELPERATYDEANVLEYYADNIHHNWYGLNNAAGIDGPIAERPCPYCNKNRRYVMVVHSGSYRAFSSCDHCKAAWEF